MIKNSLPSKISRLAEAIALGFEEIITPLESIILVEELDLGYYGLICASHFGRMVPAITVQMMPL